MAITIFLMVNGLGVAYLLYVLANFWKEGHRAHSNTRKDATQFRQRDLADVFVLTHPVSHSAQGGISVLPFQSRDGYGENPARRAASSVTHDAPVRHFSTR
jgi:hypothetical protein